jgi:Cdc6-like AAA superfamily ATPase
MKSKSELQRLSFKLGTVFKPTSPINRQDLFAGRNRQIAEIIDVIQQPGQHALLYGERGVGKTSLANMIFPNLTHASMPVFAPLINCISSDDFSAVWKRVFAEIQMQARDCDYDLPERASELIERTSDPMVEQVAPDVVRNVLHELGQFYTVVVIVDEFDSVRSKSTRRTLADTIKFLSDRNTPATVVLIGVADDADALIENHQSIERCLCQISIPRMSRDELETILQRGFRECDMSIDTSALQEISRLSRGLPHYTHLIGLYSGRCAIETESLNITETHVRLALQQSIGKAQAQIEGDYTRATTSSREDATYKQVLLAAAMAQTDATGFFYPKDVRPHLSRIVKRQVKFDTFSKHLHAFCEPTRGEVLKKDLTTARPRYRFRNPLLEPYVVIRGMADGLINEDDLKATRDQNDPQMRLFY